MSAGDAPVNVFRIEPDSTSKSLWVPRARVSITCQLSANRQHSPDNLVVPARRDVILRPHHQHPSDSQDGVTHPHGVPPRRVHISLISLQAGELARRVLIARAPVPDLNRAVRTRAQYAVAAHRCVHVPDSARVAVEYTNGGAAQSVPDAKGRVAGRNGRSAL